MKIPALALTVLSLTALLGCDPKTEEAAAADERVPLGKADAESGSCAEPDGGNVCGGPSSVGVCWCDNLCATVGDCCADFEATCLEESPACNELDLTDPEQAQQCDDRPECTSVIEPACPICDGGPLVCVDVTPPLACSELDPANATDRSMCEEREDCAVVIEPSCDICDGGPEVCIETLTQACAELSVDACEQRDDCFVGIIPDCDVCEGGTPACFPH